MNLTWDSLAARWVLSCDETTASALYVSARKALGEPITDASEPGTRAALQTFIVAFEATADLPLRLRQPAARAYGSSGGNR